MKELISVIVPVYNVEKYLHRCINSIINQKYSNLEIILVDDGSTDSSGKICDEFGTLDKRIKVIHKKNGGLSSARNAGLEIANGDYIAFVDSDDYIDERMYGALLDNIQANHADMVICCYNKWFENDNSLVKLNLLLKEKKINKDEAFEMLFDKRMSILMPVAWNKLYKKDLWEEIRYPQGKFHEDEYIVHYLINKCKRIVILPECLYTYNIRAGSIMTSKTVQASKDWIGALLDRMLFYEQLGNTKLVERQRAFCIHMMLWECKKIEEFDKLSKKNIYMIAKKMHILLKNRRVNEFISARIFVKVPMLYVYVSKYCKKWYKKDRIMLNM